MKRIKIPASLQKGDTIALVCPSGYMPAVNAQTCIETLQSWGYQVKVGKTVGHQWHYFSGTDEERLADLQEALNDPSVKAILCGRGGYGMSRIVDRLDLTRFKRNPKWVIGFSDITILHAQLFTQLGIASLHAPMAGAFNDGEYANPFVQSLRKALEGKRQQYVCDVHPYNRIGKVTAPLIGGNLSLLAHLAGTASAIPTKGKILFMEDVGEYIYNIDRMLIQLERAGMLHEPAAVIIGGFTDMKDTITPFGKDILSAVQDRFASFSYPICFNFPVSHDKENYALKIGVTYELSITRKRVTLKES
jgi:muramoyltetrapeptide carboxypeptidase